MPSTNKTAEYGLNQWLPEDKPVRDDFNEDNRIIDEHFAFIRSDIDHLEQVTEFAKDKALEAADMAKNAGDKFVDVTVTYSGNTFTVTNPPQNLPEKFTLRFLAPSTFASGDKIKINGENYTVVTVAAPGVSAPAGIFASGALVGLDMDFSSKKAFFKSGAGGGDSSNKGTWNIFTGTSAPDEPDGVFVNTTATPSQVIFVDSIPTAGTWAAANKLNVARRSMSGCLVNDVFYFAGGIVLPNTTVARLDSYDPRSNLWLSLPEMFYPRYRMSACSVGNVCYFVGGILNDAVCNRHEAFDTVSEIWSTLANVPTARAAAAGVSKDDICYHACGYTSTTSQPSNVFEAYNTTSKLWSTLQSAPTTRSRRPGCVIGTSCYFFCGASSAGRSSSVDIYNTTSNTWTSVTSIFRKTKAGVGACAIGNLVYVIGGQNGDGEYSAASDMESYDVSSKLVTILKPMPTPRIEPVVGVIDSKCYVFGGYNASGHSDAIEVYSPKGEYSKNTLLIEINYKSAKARVYTGSESDKVDQVFGIFAAYLHDGTQFNKQTTMVNMDNTGWKDAG